MFSQDIHNAQHISTARQVPVGLSSGGEGRGEGPEDRIGERRGERREERGERGKGRGERGEGRGERGEGREERGEGRGERGERRGGERREERRGEGRGGGGHLPGEPGEQSISTDLNRSLPNLGTIMKIHSISPCWLLECVTVLYFEEEAIVVELILLVRLSGGCKTARKQHFEISMFFPPRYLQISELTGRSNMI